ncbi:MAG: flippase [Bacteroidetes bacterium]|nr:flippase [Bacteroidota bacterium]
MSIKRNFLHNILFILSNILFPIITFSYTSRILGPEGIGKVQFAVSFAQYFVLVAALGIPAYGVREIAKIRGDKNKLNKLFSELITINIITSLVSLIIYAVIIYFFKWFHQDIFFFILGGIIVLSGFSVIDWFFIGIEQFHFLSIRSLIIKGVAIISLFLFIKTPKDLLVYFLITIFSILGSNFWNLFNLNGLVSIQIKKLELKKHLPVLFTLFSTSITISIYTMVDILFLGFQTDNRAVGYYSAAIKITKIAIPLIVSLGTVLIPKITQSIVSKDDDLLQRLTKHSFSFICLLAIPTSFGLFLFAPEIIIVFSGTQFIEAIPTLQLAAPLVFLIGLGSIFGPQLLIPSGNEKSYFISTVFGMITSVILNLILIRIFRDKGAAIATVLGEFIVSITAYYFVRKKMRLNFNWYLVSNAFLSSLVFIPIEIFLKYSISDTPIRLIVAIISCAFIYFTIQLIIFKEIQIREIYLKSLKILKF